MGINRNAVSTPRVQAFIRYYAAGLYHRVETHHLFLLSGGIAYSILACIIPLLVIIFTLLGKVFEASVLTGQLTSAIKTILPYEQFAETIGDLLTHRLLDTIAYRETVSVLGAIGMLFAASSLFSSLRTALNSIFKVAIVKPLHLEKLHDFALVLVVLVLFLVSLLFLPALTFFSGLSSRIGYLSVVHSHFVKLLLLPLFSYFIIFAMFFLIYALVPYQKPDLRTILVSALWAATLWEICRRIFGYYISHVALLPELYGAYLFMIVSAFWIYYSSIVLLIGATIGQLYRERRATRAPS